MTAPTAPARPATDKQIAFLTKLIDKTGMECEISEELTTKEASALIDQALEILKAKDDAKAAAKAAAPKVSLTKAAPLPTRQSAETSMSMIELLELALEKARALGI